MSGGWEVGEVCRVRVRRVAGVSVRSLVGVGQGGLGNVLRGKLGLGNGKLTIKSFKQNIPIGYYFSSVLI